MRGGGVETAGIGGNVSSVILMLRVRSNFGWQQGKRDERLASTHLHLLLQLELIFNLKKSPPKKCPFALLTSASSAGLLNSSLIVGNTTYYDFACSLIALFLCCLWIKRKECLTFVNLFFFLRYFLGFLCLYFLDRTAEEWTGNRGEREEITCSKEPQVESNP